ncbi:hypothetical protein [Parasitella parasitica]|uniref:Uncharacterized protein n=1 Tax=Parasitella parasitica TaxID=35722 RepID=A0A0B7NTQ3_9FUNG|nr:hypothetical protein [Parasitella parasitica]
MRAIRGLQITSFVVLSPVLLIMISLISMLVVAIFSHVNSWLFQTSATTAVQQPQQAQLQQLITIRNTSSDISIPYQRNFSSTKQTKRIRLFSRLRQSPMTWTILSLTYAVYIIFKRKRATKQNTTLDSSNPQAIESVKKFKKKSSKRRKIKKITAAINEPRNRPRSIQLASPPSTPPAPFVNTSKEENEPRQQQDNEIGNWVSVSSAKKNQQRKKELDVIIDPATTVTHFFPSPTFSSASSVEDHVRSEQPLNLYSFEPTPVHSEDDAEDDEEEDHFIVKKTNKNWYSPFSTGLDLDIIPKQNQTDPLCLYKVDFNYNTNIPNNHPFRSPISNFHPPLSSIELLENHPFIPSANTKNHRSAFGPVGHKVSP